MSIDSVSSSGGGQQWGWLNQEQTGGTEGSSVRGPSHWFESNGVVKTQHASEALQSVQGNVENAATQQVGQTSQGSSGDSTVASYISNRQTGSFNASDTMETEEGKRNKGMIYQAAQSQGLSREETALITAFWGIEDGRYGVGLNDPMKWRGGDSQTISGMNMNRDMMTQAGFSPDEMINDPENQGQQVRRQDFLNRESQGGYDETVRVAKGLIDHFGVGAFAAFTRGGQDAINDYHNSGGQSANFKSVHDGKTYNALADGGHNRTAASVASLILNNFEAFMSSGLRYNTYLPFV